MQRATNWIGLMTNRHTIACCAAGGSARLVLRPLGIADVPALQRLTNDRAITSAISFLSYPFTREDAETLIRGAGGTREVFIGAWHRESGALIGVVGAHHRDAGDIEIGYWIAPAFQGQGYAGEAAGSVLTRLRSAFPHHRIVAECRAENLASRRVLEKLGLRPTGQKGRRPGRLLFALP
jgi:RimJ/RimL family protein N-acetyltransferase